MNGIVAVDSVSKKIRPSQDMSIADEVMRLKQKNKPWEVIELLMKVWADRSPAEFKAFRVQVDNHRDNLADKKYGQTKGGGDYSRRFMVAIPQALQFMIRAVYTASELPMDKEFFREFAKRFPAFKLPEKI